MVLIIILLRNIHEIFISCSLDFNLGSNSLKYSCDLSCWQSAGSSGPAIWPSTHLGPSLGLSNSSGFQRNSGVDKQESQTQTALVLALFDFKELSQYHCSNTIVCMYMFMQTHA